MKRFTFEEKRDAVHLYLTNRYSFRGIAELIGVDHKSVMKWVKLYQYHGEESLRKSHCTIYSNEFKLDVLEYLHKTGASLLQAAAKFNIPSPQTVLRWKNKNEQGLLGADNQKLRERQNMPKNKQTHTEESLKKLQDELEQLRMENEFLKKLNALVQKKEKSPKKTK